MPDLQDFETHLAAVPLLAGLSRRQRHRLLDAATVVRRDDGSEVAKEGAGALALHVVLEGTAVVTIGGREVRRLGPGDYFGEISLIDGKPRSATVTAAGSLTTLAVPHLAFSEMLDENPAAARDVLIQLCARLREAEAR